MFGKGGMGNLMKQAQMMQDKMAKVSLLVRTTTTLRYY